MSKVKAGIRFGGVVLCLITLAMMSSFYVTGNGIMSGTLYLAFNDRVTAYVNGGVVYSSPPASTNAAYTGGQWDVEIPISLYIGTNVIACEVENGPITGGFDAAVWVNGEDWVIPGGDDDKNYATLDPNCGANPLWEYWYTAGSSGPPPNDSQNDQWFESDYDESTLLGWREGRSPLGSGAWDNTFACTTGILQFPDESAFFRNSFKVKAPIVVVGWESYPINKVRVLLPWIALVAAIMAGVSLVVLRRRRAQS